MYTQLSILMSKVNIWTSIRWLGEHMNPQAPQLKHVFPALGATFYVHPLSVGLLVVAFRRSIQKEVASTNSTFFQWPSGILSSSNQLLAAPSLAPFSKLIMRFQHYRDDVDEFLASDLEFSFASTVSLNSSNSEPMSLTPPENISGEPIDICVVPV